MSENIGFQDYNALRDKAYYLRHNYVEDMDKHLLNFETRASAHNLGVFWALNENQLANTILDLLPSKQYNKVCIDHPSLSSVLANIPQINEVPIDNLLMGHDEVDTLIVDADFAIAESGSLVFLDKKSSNLFNTFRNLIVIANIDQFLVKQTDLSVFIDLKYGASNYPKDIKFVHFPFQKILKDPFPSTESSGFTEELVRISVVLYENSISDYMSDPFLRQSVYCIKCGKCASVCPVTQLNKDISPIDIVKMNCLESQKKTQSIFKQTTLCGNCQKVCPVKIPLKEMLIYEMQLVNETRDTSNNKLLHGIFMKRNKMNKYNSPFFRFFLMRFLFGKNKLLYNYYSNTKNTFFNITRKSQENINTDE